MGQLQKGRKVMKRSASDNKYLHKDFHVSMNIVLSYIYENFGKEELINYLRQYSEAYYKPLNQQLQNGDITPLVEYFKDIYAKEEWPVQIKHGEDFLEISQESCPGISQIRSKGSIPSPYYFETYKTVYETLCKNTPFTYELQYFNEETGACRQLIKRKEDTK
jgi:hypothetical protein